jgi:hypothetical protein
MDDATAFGWTVRNDRYQLVHRDAGSQLFDLVADPGAATDLLTQKPVPSGASTTADELEKTGTALRGE